MAKKPLLGEQLIFFHWFSSLRTSMWEPSLGGEKKPTKYTRMQRASQKRQSWWRQRWGRVFIYEKDIDQLHTPMADRLKLAVIAPVMQRDREAQAPLSKTYIQSSQMRFVKLNWIPARDSSSWFIFLVSYSPTNCAISSWRWVGNNWTAKLWFTQPIKESWDGPLDKSSFTQSSWTRTTFGSDIMAKITMTQLILRT